MLPRHSFFLVTLGLVIYASANIANGPTALEAILPDECSNLYGGQSCNVNPPPVIGKKCYQNNVCNGNGACKHYDANKTQCEGHTHFVNIPNKTGHYCGLPADENDTCTLANLGLCSQKYSCVWDKYALICKEGTLIGNGALSYMSCN